MKKPNPQEDNPTSFPDDDNNSSCFSSETEKEFQKHKTPTQQPSQPQSNQPPQPSQPKSSKWRDLRERGMWSLIMIGLFALILSLGHFYCALLVLFVILCIFHELINIPRYKERNAFIPKHSAITWSFFFTGMYFLIITMIKTKISFLTKYKLIDYLLTYHNIISFSLYILCFLSFIQHLKKGYYKYQFGQFAFIHVILILFGTSAALIINNIFNGIIWFLIPASLVIVNDITAYIWGRMLGKHMLTPLSPKKTIEGFVGAFFSTLIWGYFITEILVKYDWVLCPSNNVDVLPFKTLGLECEAYEFRKYMMFEIFGRNINVRVIQLHTFFFGLFAGLIAPFGGLFASGFKRAIKIKDFADTIPGHGGLTDRMDCQILMGLFTYVWLNQFAFNANGNINEMMGRIDHMTFSDKKYLLGYLKESLGM